MFNSFTFLVKFIPTRFIVFDVITNEVIFLISFSDDSLLVFMKMQLIFVCWVCILQFC